MFLVSLKDVFVTGFISVLEGFGECLHVPFWRALVDSQLIRQPAVFGCFPFGDQPVSTFTGRLRRQYRFTVIRASRTVLPDSVDSNHLAV